MNGGATGESYTHGVATAARQKLSDAKKALGLGYKVPEQTGPVTKLKGDTNAKPRGYTGGAQIEGGPYKGGGKTTRFASETMRYLNQ